MIAEAGIVDQGLSLVGNFILGGVALLCLAIAYWAIKELKRAKDDHIKAMVTASDRREHTAKDHAEAYQKTANATVAAIEKLTVTETDQTNAIRDNTRALNDLRGAVDGQKSVLDSVVREAVRRSGGWPRVPGPAGEGGE